ncbi:DarT ssDNA thymidine ADP-ribosyltransferase family protein [Acinetobacter pittii]|uniref:DarT ssDNA thymidine ADP-ribosyltransferase family protein n=1 Tax=Acinetobacter pittii TaxID=48296 RepID=UPI003AA9122E
MTSIQEVINKREITSIFHFTRVENLNNILTNGIVPRSNLSNKTSIFNDTVRADGKLDHSSFSISFPNHLMFYRLRCAVPESKWAILVFKSDLLTTNNCLFYPVNAASSNVSRSPVNMFRGGQALERMFTYSTESRESVLRSCDPTDVQAEVMIPGVVTMENLKGCILSEKDLVEFFSKRFPNIKFVHCHSGRQVFNTRKAFLWGY